MPVVGTCLCSKVKVEVVEPSLKLGACHCTSCRKWSGGPAMAVDCGQNVNFEGQEWIGVYDSSAWADRGFCKNCGTHLFYRLKEQAKYIIPIGLLEDLQGLVFEHQIFIDQKPDYYHFGNETHNQTKAEVFASASQ